MPPKPDALSAIDKKISALGQAEKQLWDKLPKDGSYVGIRKMREELGLIDEQIWNAVQQLVGNKLAKTGPGYGGTLRRLVDKAEEIPTPPVDAATAERMAEHELYEPMKKVIKEKWARTMKLEDFVVQITAKQGRRDTGGTWTRPDLIVVAVSVYEFVPGKFVDAITFEVKTHDNFDVTAVYEALSHLRSGTRAYVFVEVPTPQRENLAELVLVAGKEAGRHGVGLIVADKADDYETWRIEVEATRREPDPAALDAFLSDQLTEENKKQVRKWLK